MKDRYRHEMDLRRPRQEKLDELYEMIEGGTEMKHAKRLSGRAAAILVCAALAITAAAAAAVPAVWEKLWEQLGAFAPYAQTIDGAVCRDQGIEVQVLSALSDDLEARFYLAVRDMEGDRLNEYLTLEGQLENDAKRDPDAELPRMSVSTVGGSSQFEFISYDPEAKTALFCASILYWKDEQPTQDAHLSLTGMTTQKGYLYGGASCASVTGRILESLPVEEQDQANQKIDHVSSLGYTEADLPGLKVVLAAEQNPMPMEGTEDMWISSMGFADDGRFHIRLGFAEGVAAGSDGDSLRGFFSDLFLSGSTDKRQYAHQITPVPGGLDILFPLIKLEDLELLQDCQARFYGDYTRPGTEVQGAWNIDFQLEYHPSVTLDWTGDLAGRQVRRVTVSPLSVTMYSNDVGGFHRAVLYAVKKDGSTVAAEPDTGSYSNSNWESDGEPIWDTYNTWKFEAPVDLEELACLTLMDQTIPVH